MAFQEVPTAAAKKLPKHPVPVILLARLAVDQAAQRQGLGRLLLVDAMKRCLQLSKELGVHAIEVEAIDGEAKQFYLKYGFAALEDSELHLYLPIATIEKSGW
jgi:GNAT superfamily N-acetyltransferase